MMKRTGPWCLLLLAGLAACVLQSRQVTGKIAVVLQDGQAIHPAHASVWLVEAAVAEERLSRLRSAGRPLDAEITRLQGECESARIDRRNLGYNGAALAEAFRLAEASGNQTATTNAQAELEKHDQERARLSNRERALEEELARLETRKNDLVLRAFQDAWPDLRRHTHSDAGGGFTLAVPAHKKMVVLAVCSLGSKDRGENFQWCVPIPATNAPPLLLNNENVFR